MNHHNTKLALVIAVAAASFPAAVAAVEGISTSLEEIVVTARKREESLQNVGLAVSALSQTEIARTFARDLSDLAFVSPNLIIDDTAQGPGGVAAIFIRGIGAADVEKNFDPAVGVVVNGIFLGANAGSLFRSIDLASVEVLRGPQGTLFGRNTIGGLINITNTQPTGELGAKLRAGAEDYDTYYGDAIINFGVTDDIAAKVSLARRDQQEGYYQNITEGGDAGRNDYKSYGLNLLWDINEKLAIEGSYQKEETDQDTPPLLNTAQERHAFCSGFGFCSPSLSEPITGDRYKIAQDYVRPAGEQSTRSNPVTTSARADLIQAPGDATFDTDFYEFEARWEINDAMKVDYLYGYWESDETILSNWDGTPILLYGTDRPAQYDQNSNELRLTYDDGGPLASWLGSTCGNQSTRFNCAVTCRRAMTLMSFLISCRKGSRKPIPRRHSSRGTMSLPTSSPSLWVVAIQKIKRSHGNMASLILALTTRMTTGTSSPRESAYATGLLMTQCFSPLTLRDTAAAVSTVASATSRMPFSLTILRLSTTTKPA